MPTVAYYTYCVIISILCLLCHNKPTIYHTISSVCRILKRGGEARNFRKFERNIDQNLKLSYSNFGPIFRPKSGEEQKKKGLHSNFVPFFAQIQVISSPKLDAQLAKGGSHTSILLTFLCNFAILATQRGGHGPMPPPLNTPLHTIPIVP